MTINGRAPVKWPHQVGVVPAEAHCRQERAADRILETAVASHGAVVCQVVVGLGGVGKTQLAAGLAHRLFGSGSLDLLVWVSATSRSAVVTSYAQAFADTTGVDGPSSDHAAGRFLAWLATSQRRWLIVLDDVTDPNDLRGLWPPNTRSGRTVVTTRSTDSALIAGRRRIDVNVFTSDESAAYLAAKLGCHPFRLDEAVGLADDLGHLPLALAQAGAYIMDRTSMTCAGYRRRLVDRRRCMAELAPRALPDDYPHTVAATWSLSIDRADTLPPTGLARPVLELAALLDENGIPVTVFTSRAVRSYLKIRTGEPVEDGDVTDALDNLVQFSLATIAPGAGTVRVHGLLQRVVREACSDHIDVLAVTAADALHEIWPQIERDREHSQTLRANTAALVTYTRHLLWTHGAYQVLFDLGRSLGVTGQAAAAAAYFHTLHNTASGHLGPDHPTTLTSRNDLASWRGEAGDPAAAVATCQELLADRLRVRGPDDPGTLITRHALAYWRGRAGDPAGAVVGFAELLSDRIRVLKADHSHTLLTHLDLAYWRGQAGDPAGAVVACEALLPDFIRVLGHDYPDTLTARRNLAYWRGQAGDPAGAVVACEALLPDFIRVLGHDYPDTLTVRLDLASWRGETGDPAGALAAHEDLLGVRERILGADHQAVLTTRNDLAHWRGQADDPAGAVAAYEALLPDLLRVLGSDHPDTLIARCNLASWRGETGDLAGAVTAFEDLLPDLLRVFKADHPNIPLVRDSLEFWREALY
ncbi:tetratricopeptide repeat protein [Micromonospora wenchangensis]|uniref:tetratricopeptide repeat protein n=1 Tax=Micromonospora wenchangensis TaxID=1185415 RepID=UPI003D71B8C7